MIAIDKLEVGDVIAPYVLEMEVEPTSNWNDTH